MQRSLLTQSEFISRKHMLGELAKLPAPLLLHVLDHILLSENGLQELMQLRVVNKFFQDLIDNYILTGNIFSDLPTQSRSTKSHIFIYTKLKTYSSKTEWCEQALNHLNKKSQQIENEYASVKEQRTRNQRNSIFFGELSKNKSDMFYWVLACVANEQMTKKLFNRVKYGEILQWAYLIGIPFVLKSVCDKYMRYCDEETYHQKKQDNKERIHKCQKELIRLKNSKEMFWYLKNFRLFKTQTFKLPNEMPRSQSRLADLD